MSTQLRVLSWNIHDGLFVPGQDKDLVTAIRIEKPDVVILLEYNIPGTQDNRANSKVDDVVRREGYGRPLRWCLSRRIKKGRSAIRVGAAFPRMDRVSKISPVAGARYYQGHAILKVDLTAPTAKPLYLAMVHNHHKGDVPRLSAMLKEWKNSAFKPNVAIGDFNRLFDSSEWVARELKPIKSEWESYTPDCINIKGGSPAPSCLATHNYSQLTGRRIDYPLRHTASAVRITALRHLTDVVGSDHIPIVADFEIP
jgi:endonuclease/exonuclease/phosphatase family metal-dependent hydrolase